MLHGLALVIALSLGSSTATALGGGGAFCSRTAQLQLHACKAELGDDYLSASAICLNVTDRGERAECFHEVWIEAAEQRGLCREQLQARRDLCALVGEGRYDPDFDPDDFESDFTNLQNPNAYFPLPIGGKWAYATEGETNVVTVRDATKNVEGVTCIVVNDLVIGEESSEDTDDWYAQAKNGDAWYCGEQAKDFELFEGDEPQEPELVSIDGSFKHGRDGDRAGGIFLRDPTVGTTYRQEVSLGNAEDAATILSTSYGYGEDDELDELVPQELAEQYCPNSDCIVTSDFTPIEPGVFERKYYSPGVGVFLETKPEDEEINVLVGCNVDPKCSPLP
ncbi:MAG: hypothetical protein ACR2P8_05755 [Myxococcota bacterium]